MSKSFRDWNLGQDFLLPPSVHDFVPAGHLSRFVVALVTEELDLSAIMTSYKGEKGQPPYHPTMMVALLLYAYAVGIYSSRRIARACTERVDFMAIVALDAPDFRTISEFRRRHLKALAGLFLQVLKLCERAGLVTLGHVALDGTKIKANASKHKAMSYEYMKKREAELQAEIDSWLNAAEAADAAEDKAFGPDNRGDELPDWVADKQTRLVRIREAKAELEAEAKAKAQAEQAAREKKDDKPGPGRKAAPPSQEPEPKAQRNFTDPESRILKTKDGYIQGYNAQAAGMRIIRSSWRTRSVTTAVISHTLRRCSMASRRTSDAIPTKYRPMPATARQPISAPSAGEGSKVTSLPADRSMEPSRPPPPDRPSPVRHSLGWLSGSDARGIVAVTDYASRWSSRYSDRLRKREGSGSSCCEGSTR
jgi:transposase